MCTQLLTISQAAEIIAVTDQTIRDYINKGKLPAKRLTRGLRIHPNDLEKLLKPAHPLTKPTPLTK